MTAPAATLDGIDLDALADLSPEALLRFAFATFGRRAAIGTSLQKTGLVLVDLASRLGVGFRVFFVDTLLNHEETYELLEAVQQRYGIEVERFQPREEDIEGLHRSAGQYAHFLARRSCCHVRKVLPLRRALETVDCWIAGLRGDQSDHRREHAAKAEWFETAAGRRILKLNPLLDWDADAIDAYTREHAVPRNALYDYVSPYGERYFVIGCRPCHIPVREDLGKRAGKFPWEQGSKECGLHEKGSGI